MSQEIDITNDLDSMDLSNVETGIPLLADGLYVLQVAELSTKANKKGTGSNLNFKFVTTEPCVDIKGNPVNPGFPVYDLISLVKSEKYDPIPKLAEFKEAVTGSKAGSFNPLEQYLGLTVTVKLKVERDAEYGDKNRIQRYIKKG